MSRHGPLCLPSPRAFAAVLACLAGAGCSTYPDVRGPEGPAGDYPTLAPIDALLAQADVAPLAPAPDLSARAARLKSRASALGSP